MTGRVPHICQYQGSKRQLAPQILQYMPLRFERLIEPFAGMAAITIAVAYEKRTERFVINDINKPLVNMLKMAIEEPNTLLERYTALWEAQYAFEGDHLAHYNHDW